MKQTLYRADMAADMRLTFCRKVGCDCKPTFKIMQMVCGLEMYIYCCKEHKQWASQFLREIDESLKDILDAKINKETDQN